MGILIAAIVIGVWGAHLFYILSSVQVDFASPLFYFHMLLQGYLYTGLFITGHDAMHKTVSRNRKVNKFVGRLSSFLFAGLSYDRLVKNHFKHHKYPGTDQDPDFYVKSQNFFVWWAVFLYRYTTITQLIIMAVLFNVLNYFFVEINVIMFWVVPAFLGTFQLFFFGTYLPHRKPHSETMEPHKARTQKKNHLWAMLSCYFFGYHFEHHDAPHQPWWRLYKSKT
jgi:beta-carotene ketolase (CrtW type)